MSVANKDAAVKCIARARVAVENGDDEKAERMLKRSLSMFPTDEAKQMLANRANWAKKKAAPKPATNSTPQRASSSPKPAAMHTPPQGNWTKQQSDLVAVINRKKDYYDILGVDKSATDNDLKKAYRKLALKLHPDKNRAPGADEAFKSVSSAYAFLTNADDRAFYDRTGMTQGDAQSQQSQRHANMHHNYQEVRPEDIFNMFFGGQMPGGAGGFQTAFNQNMRTRQARGGQQQQQQQGQRQGLGQLLHLLPFLILIVFSLFGGQNDTQNFSLQRTSQFTVERSSNLGTTFYVTQQFQRYYARDRRTMRDVEAQADRDQFGILRKECDQQKKQKARKIRDAKKFRGPNAPRILKEAHEFELASCDKIRSLYAHA